MASLYKPGGFLVSSPNNLLYPVKFAVTKRLINDDDDDLSGKFLYLANVDSVHSKLVRPSFLKLISGVTSLPELNLCCVATLTK